MTKELSNQLTRIADAMFARGEYQDAFWIHAAVHRLDSSQDKLLEELDDKNREIDALNAKIKAIQNDDKKTRVIFMSVLDACIDKLRECELALAEDRKEKLK